MSKDNFGDRLKEVEQLEAGRRFHPNAPVMVRIDGRSFSNWTRGLARPYDERLSRLFIETTKYLVEESNAIIGFCQSDEISLILHTENEKSEIFFNGKIQKLVSVLASIATAKFNSLVPTVLPERAGNLATFDCRCWGVLNKQEAVDNLIWRVRDAEKNSKSMAARELFSHKELENKTSNEMMTMMEEKGVVWGNYPDFFKRGTFVRRVTELRELTAEEREKIPEKFRPPVGAKFIRSSVKEMSWPPLTKVLNQVNLIFNNESPILESDMVGVRVI